MLNKKALAASVSAPPAEYVEDVFSTYLYSGNSANNTITNGIDLSTKGGLVWMKSRTNGDGTEPHSLFDTTRGLKQLLVTSSTSAQQDESGGGGGGIKTWNTNGFTITDAGFNAYYNYNGGSYVSWTFRKAKKFFDVVTYTGNGTAGRTISHNLGSVPGMMIVKCTSTSGNWSVYHRSTGATDRLILNLTNATGANNTIWNDTTPTSTVFTVGDNAGVNSSGATYVAYLFAHDAGGFGTAGTDNIISCGSFTTDGSGLATVTLGYEPQFVLWKQTDGADNWYLNDIMRGMSVGSSDKNLSPNTSGAESAGGYETDPTATGFIANPGIASKNYIYMAIRRPMKTPTSGTDVFSTVARTGTGATATVTTGFAPDLVTIQGRGGDAAFWFDRLRGFTKRLRSDGTSAETSPTDEMLSMNNTNFVLGTDTSGSVNYSTFTYANWAFRRAPGFFDVVCYTGTGSATTVTHNLGVVPELIIVKRRVSTGGWCVYNQTIGNTQYMYLNTTDAAATFNLWNDTTPTSSVFSLSSGTQVNGSGQTFVAYLFATVTGVSKVGSYTGTGSTQTINCGFTAGARFVLIKRTDSTGDWYVWDTARGIVSGNDPYLLLNSTAAEVTNTDYIDPVNSGFEISSTAPAAINANGGSFIFMAIA